jgi:hypothetical protein
MPFSQCCENPNVVSYSIVHNPKPLVLAEELLFLIETLLWYLPDVSTSEQSSANTDIDNVLVGDSYFANEILSKLGMNAVNDVAFRNPTTDETSHYRNNLCGNCQKMIISIKRSTPPETKTRSLLRHLRNSIAHGRFQIIGTHGMFFDVNSGTCTAIVKVDINKLIATLRVVTM